MPPRFSNSVIAGAKWRIGRRLRRQREWRSEDGRTRKLDLKVNIVPTLGRIFIRTEALGGRANLIGYKNGWDGIL